MAYDEAARLAAWQALQSDACGQWHEIFSALAPGLGPAMEMAPRHVPCPVHGGHNGFRLFRHYNDSGRGVCNTCGVKASGFTLLAWVNDCSFRDAVRDVAGWLRADTTFVPREAPRRVFVLPPPDYEKAREHAHFVLNSSTALPFTPALRYLLARGIPRSSVPDTLFAHAELGYYEFETKTFVGKLPCLLAPIVAANGELVSVHRIYVDEFGRKAAVAEPKKMLSPCGPLQGAAVRLYEPGETLALTEGIETALAVHALSGVPVWACVSATLMELVEVPAHVKYVQIWADLDRSGRGLEAALVLKSRLEERGVVVVVMLPPGPIPEDSKGVDWLDVLCQRRVQARPCAGRFAGGASPPASVLACAPG